MEDVAASLLSQIDLRLASCRNMQSLWAGYGHICSVTAHPPPTTGNNQPTSLILKHIAPPAPRKSQKPTESHIRKVLSYQIEQHFYTTLAPLLPPDIAVATCVASTNSNSSYNSAAATLSDSESETATATAMLLTDLRGPFPVAGEKRAQLSSAQVYAALDWLAGFHGFWWSAERSAQLVVDREKTCLPPLEHYAVHQDIALKEGAVWLNGGYTYLATRRDEYDSLKEDEGSHWREALCEVVGEKGLEMSIAEVVAAVLAPSRAGEEKGALDGYLTLIHGDVKSENLFTTVSGDQAAFFDFQYVGLGLGVCDLAKLFTCSVPLFMLNENYADSDGIMEMDKGEKDMLQYYQEKLQERSGRDYPWANLVRHWETALVDWLRFQASWGFWGNTEWLEARVRKILVDDEWREWLFAQTRRTESKVPDKCIIA